MNFCFVTHFLIITAATGIAALDQTNVNVVVGMMMMIAMIIVVIIA